MAEKVERDGGEEERSTQRQRESRLRPD